MESRNHKQYALLQILIFNRRDLLILGQHGYSPSALVKWLNQGTFEPLSPVPWSHLSADDVELIASDIHDEFPRFSREEAENFFARFESKYSFILIEFEEVNNDQISLISYTSHIHIYNNGSHREELKTHYFDNPVSINMQKYLERKQAEQEVRIEMEECDRISMEKMKEDKNQEEIIKQHQSNLQRKAAQFTSIFSAIQVAKITEVNVVAVRRLLQKNKDLVNHKNRHGQTAAQILIQKILEKLATNDKVEIKYCYIILRYLIDYGSMIDQKNEQQRKDWHTVFYLSNYRLNVQEHSKHIPKVCSKELAKRSVLQDKLTAVDVFDGALFNIKELENIHLYEIKDKLFSNLDFFAADEEGREQVGVKLGNIYFEFAPTGKGHYELKIYDIDATHGKLNQIFAINRDETILPFESIVPFKLSVNYDQFTIKENIKDFPPAKALCNEYFEIQKSLVARILSSHSARLTHVSSEPTSSSTNRRPVAIPSSSAGSGAFGSIINTLNSTFWGMLSPTSRQDKKDEHEANKIYKKK